MWAGISITSLGSLAIQVGFRMTALFTITIIIVFGSQGVELNSQLGIGPGTTGWQKSTPASWENRTSNTAADSYPCEKKYDCANLCAVAVFPSKYDLQQSHRTAPSLLMLTAREISWHSLTPPWHGGIWERGTGWERVGRLN